MSQKSSDSKIRADLAVVQRGWADSRTKAAALLMTGIVLEEDRVISKAGTVVFPEKLRLKEELQQFVSRGGLKLLSFLEATPEFSTQGKRCVDVGASTGGFTDCLLKREAASVVCIDVGTNQLDWKLRQDPRVVSLEQTDIRDVTLEKLKMEAFELAVADVSFIGLKLILPALIPLMKKNADILLLVKPQFEVGRDAVGKGGIVKDEAAASAALQAVVDVTLELGCRQMKCIPSGVKGREGNQEYFLWVKAS